RRGMFARASWGQDYHSIMRKRLDKLAEYLETRVPDVEIKSMVDTGVLSDRAVAERAGLGDVGRNGFEIGRASCRERVWRAEGMGGVARKQMEGRSRRLTR